jgi:hypothetical protein
MMRHSAKHLRLWVVLAIALLSGWSAYSQDALCPKDGRPDCPRAVAFFRQFQAALARNDRKTMAEMMEYPFLTSINKRKAHISTRTKFLQHFDEIFDKGVRCEILGATDRDVWGKYDGFTIGDGAIWFDDPIPAGENVDPKSPDFWSKGTFKVRTVNNDSYYPCLNSGKTAK